MASANAGNDPVEVYDADKSFGPGTRRSTSTVDDSGNMIVNGNLTVTGSFTPPSATDLAGTANQVILSASGTNVLNTRNVTLSLPQSIHTAATPTFAGATLSGLTASRLLSSNGSSVLASTDLNSWVVGTSNEILIADDGDGTITVSLPDDVSIDGLTLDDLTASRLVYSNGSKVLSSTDLNSWITGTANRVSVADDGDGTITLSAPQDIATASAVTFATVNTGQGANELYDMDQDVQTGDGVTFATVNTGQGANELYDMDQNVQTGDGVTFVTVDTGQGANELYDMDQNVKTTNAVTFTTVDTGQGANELYDMDQNVLTTSNVTFANAAFTGLVDIGNATTDYVTVTGMFDADLLPYTSATPGLGSASYAWTDSYITTMNGGLVDVSGDLDAGDDVIVGDDITMSTTGRIVLDDTAADGPVFLSHVRLEQGAANGWYNVLTYNFHITEGAVSIFWIMTVFAEDTHNRAVYKGVHLFYAIGGTISSQSGWADFIVESDSSWSYAVAVSPYSGTKTGLRVAGYVNDIEDTTFDIWYFITESEGI